MRSLVWMCDHACVNCRKEDFGDNAAGAAASETFNRVDRCQHGLGVTGDAALLFRIQY